MKLADDQELKANKNLFKGKKGERIDKRTGSTEVNKEKIKVNVKGSKYTNLIVRKTIERSNKLANLSISLQERGRFRNLLSSKEVQLSEK